VPNGRACQRSSIRWKPLAIWPSWIPLSSSRIHEQRVAFKTDEAVFSWVASKGADAKRFTEVFNGFSMQSKVQRADQDATAAKIGGVPSLAVDGKYLINNEAASSYEDSAAHHRCRDRQGAPGTQGQVRFAFAQSLLTHAG
jgi:hypothetical protein